MQEVQRVWVDTNPLGFDESLLAMKAYAPYHHMYAVSMIFAIANNHADKVPSPSVTWDAAQQNGNSADLIKIAGNCLKAALKTAHTRVTSDGRIFNPANWVKSNQCLNDINSTISPMLMSFEMADKAVYDKLVMSLKITPECFSYRLQAG